MGEAVLWLAPGRRRLILSNLHHAFPNRPLVWCRRLARSSSRQLIETALLSLATPHLSETRIRTIARLAPSVESWARGAIDAKSGRGQPTVFATLHLGLWESQTWLKLLSPVPLPDFGIIFRPLDLSAADQYMKKVRERFGMRLLSRKGGFAEALRILRGGGVVGVLFDQNAGDQGALTLLFGRVCSTTELPGLLASKFGAKVFTFYPRRSAFWRVAFESEAIEYDGTAAGITIALNRWLEEALFDDRLCASWLWAHDRWRHQDVPSRRLRLESRRDLLSEELRARELEALPRRTRIWIRLPNWLGDVMMTLPLLRALRTSRPDAEITLVAKTGFMPLLQASGVADRLQALPPRGPRYFLHFWRLRRSYPDVWILFTHSLRGDLEAWLTRAPQRFGVLRRGKRRPLLTHAYRVPADYDETRRHQLELWDEFLRHFGLAAPLDRSPIQIGSGDDRRAPNNGPIGLIPGSENNPEKRWPAGHWRRLIEAMPSEHFLIFGTASDLPVAAAIAEGMEAGRVENLAGQTGLAEYMARLTDCRLLVTNDTGGMHLANGLGVPVIALFGPTNPLRTGPVFASPFKILQPPGCPPTGGGRLADLASETVIALIQASCLS